MEIEMLIKKQRAYFEKGKTKDVSWRIAALKTLRKTILKLTAHCIKILENHPQRHTCVRQGWCCQSFLL